MLSPAIFQHYERTSKTMKHLCIVSALTCALLLLSACGAQPIPTTTNTKPEVKNGTDLMAEWNDLAATDYDHLDFDRAMIIANELALQGPNGLNPLFEVLEDPTAPKMAKILAVASLSPHVNDSHSARLIPLTDAQNDSITRGCAAHLLGNCYAADAFFKVRELAHDDDEHVSKVASMVMLRKGDVEVLPNIMKIWESPDASAKDRDEIVLGMPPMIAMKHLDIFTDSICDEKLSDAARSRAIKVLTEMAGPDVVPVIKACLDETEDDATREALEAAIATIEKREAEGKTAAPIQMPGGVDLVFQSKPEAPTETAPEDVPEEEQNK